MRFTRKESSALRLEATLAKNTKKKILKINKEPILFFIDGNEAYFTYLNLRSAPLDDADDTPYEHNASVFTDPNTIKIIFEVMDLVRPCDGQINSKYSAEDINQKMLVPWLQDGWSDVHKVKIWAGTPLSEFKRIIKALNGKIYTEE